MKIITTRFTLLLALNKVQRGVSSKSVLPVLEGILFEAHNGILKLTSYDLEMGIETKLNVDVVVPGKFVISSKLINDIVKKLPDGDIMIDINENNVVTIECEHSKMTINGISADEFPELPVIDKNNPVQIPQNILKEMIRQTIFAKSEDEIRPLLTGVLFEIIEDSITLVALDGFRMAVKNYKCVNDINEKAVIPGKTLMELMKLIDDNDDKISIYFSKNKVLFESGETILISRLLDGEFVNYMQLIPKNYDINVLIDRVRLLESCERASLIAKDSKNNMIRFHISDNKMEIKSNSENGKFYEEIEISQKSAELEIAFNAKYLMDVLKIIPSKSILMKYTTNVSPSIIKNCDDENYLYLVLPVRISR